MYSASEESEIRRYWHTPLHYEVSQGRTERVRSLLREGADVNARGPAETTALHFACRCGSPDLVQLLLDAGADVEAKDHDGTTPAEAAAAAGNTEALRVLTEHGAHFTGALLARAALEGHLSCVEFLLSKGVPVDSTLDGGGTALFWAAYRSHTEVARVLLEHGADPNSSNRGTKILEIAGSMEGEEQPRKSREATVQPIFASTPIYRRGKGAESDVAKLLCHYGATK
jgi:ankyrin repeat/SOCS box protein 13